MRGVPVAIFIVCVFPFVPLLASAESFESFVDLYAGAVSPQESDVTASTQLTAFIFSAGPETSVTRKAQFGSSFILGGRYGFWMDWVGFALDLSWFRQQAPAVDLTLVPLSYLMMVRRPLPVDRDAPPVRLQPYLGLGPSLVWPTTSIDYQPALSYVRTETGLPIVGAKNVFLGLDVRAGLAWKPDGDLPLFWEYRFTYGRLDAREDGGIGGITRRASATLSTHYVVMGISFR